MVSKRACDHSPPPSTTWWAYDSTWKTSRWSGKVNRFRCSRNRLERNNRHYQPPVFVTSRRIISAWRLLISSFGRSECLIFLGGPWISDEFCLDGQRKIGGIGKCGDGGVLIQASRYEYRLQVVSDRFEEQPFGFLCLHLRIRVSVAFCIRRDAAISPSHTMTTLHWLPRSIISLSRTLPYLTSVAATLSICNTYCAL